MNKCQCYYIKCQYALKHTDTLPCWCTDDNWCKKYIENYRKQYPEKWNAAQKQRKKFTNILLYYR